MEPVGDHPVPSGPLAVRWLAYELDEIRAGALTRARLALENAGSVPWAPEGEGRVCLAYHWLDELGNPIVWDGLWTALPHPVGPGERVETDAVVRGPMPPGRYQLAFDLVADDRYWFADVGNRPLEREANVAPRIAARSLAVLGADPEALAGQAEPIVAPEEAAAVAYLAPGCVPAPDWSTRVLDAHAEGFGAVGGSVEVTGGPFRRRPDSLAAWAPGPGRVPGFEHPLLCPSLVRDLEPDWAEPVEGLPALRPPADEPWLYDGRIRVIARPRSGRRRA